MSPYAAGRPCPGVGPRRGSCPNLIRGSERNCEACAPYVKAKNKRYDKARGNSGERGYDAAWRRVRIMKLARSPMCQCDECKENRLPAVLVHHIMTISERPDLRLDPDNMLSMANECHERVHKNERWGEMQVKP